MLIRDLIIKGYRCFEDFSMNGLTRVNLLVGNNNSGKTSFLEAVYLLVNQPSMGTVQTTIREIFENRGEFSQQVEMVNNQSKQIITQKFFLDRFFYGFGKNKLDKFSILGRENSEQIKVFSFLETEELSFYYPEDVSTFNDMSTSTLDWVPCAFFDFSITGIMKKQLISDFDEISTGELALKKDFSLLIQNSFFLSNRQISFDEIAKLWDKINLSPKEYIVIEALKIIIPDVERVGFSISPGMNTIKLKLKDQTELVPLSSMGDGMNRILTLAMALVSTEKGVLLIDEIETGLHYEAQLDMWRLVLKTAQDLDVQVFATTHSWDCIAAFKEALQELEDQSVAKLFRLDSKYGKLRAVEYDAEEIRIAVNQGIEVR
jgi:AAA15 family ATPase/GTPase